MLVLETGGCLDVGKNAGRLEGSEDSFGFLFAACCSVCLVFFNSLSSCCMASCMVATAKMCVLAKCDAEQLVQAAEPAR